MRLGMTLGYSGGKFGIDIDLVRKAEELGFTSAWTAEAYGSDAATPLAWVAAQTSKIHLGTAIMQIPARTPAMTAMTAMTLDQLSGGRFILGLGPSGPQVVEGWYGVPYGKPLTRTREAISIIRKILAREAPLTHDGELYQIPYTGEGSMGLGKPLKSILKATRPIEIFTAAIAPRGVACAGEVADGVIPIWMNPEKPDPIIDNVRKGLAKSGEDGKESRFRIAPFVNCQLGDLEECRMRVKFGMALYIGGMGARDKNFYNDYATALGYGDAAKKIQDLYLDGKKQEAAMEVPDGLVDDVALVGSADRIRDRLQAWTASDCITDMLIQSRDPAVLELLAEAVL